MRNAILEALEARFQAQVSEAEATIKIYLENPVGIGEHPQVIDEFIKQIKVAAENEEAIYMLQNTFQDEISPKEE